MVTEKDLDRLRNLQDILSEKIRLEHEIVEIPKQLIALEEARSRTRKAYIDKNLEYEKVKASEVEARELMKEAEAARERTERILGEPLTTQREYEALDKERHYAVEKEQQFGEEVKKKDRMLQELDEQLKLLASLSEQQEQELAEKRAGIETEVSKKKKQSDALLKQERKLTDDLDPEVVYKFERIIRNKMGLGIVAIKGNVCMGCHMILPVQFSNDVHLGNEFIFCPYCSRILFFEESVDEELFFDIDDTGALYDADEADEEELEDEEKGEEEILENEE
jgi:predicted  nucleic acid-binding Zn-ribbon protein